MKFKCLSERSALCNKKKGKLTAGPFGLEILALGSLVEESF